MAATVAIARRGHRCRFGRASAVCLPDPKGPAATTDVLCVLEPWLRVRGAASFLRRARARAFAPDAAALGMPAIHVDDYPYEREPT
jgi:hypothetical protein